MEKISKNLKIVVDKCAGVWYYIRVRFASDKLESGWEASERMRAQS